MITIENKSPRLEAVSEPKAKDKKEFTDHIPKVKQKYRGVSSQMGEEAREAIREIYREIELNNKF